MPLVNQAYTSRILYFSGLCFRVSNYCSVTPALLLYSASQPLEREPKIGQSHRNLRGIAASDVPTAIMQRSLARHSPLITSRIEFRPSKVAGNLPVITPRIDFGEEWALPTADIVDPTASIVDKNLDDDLSDVMDDDDDEIFLRNIDNSKIPKPQGEPGRPNCGGYSIESQLHGWSPDLLENVTVSLDALYSVFTR